MEKLVIDIRDRINNEIKNKFKSYYYAAKAVNKSPSYFYGYRNLQTITALDEMCRIVGVNLEYILTGKNKGKYKETNFSFDNLFKLYKASRGNNTSAEIQTMYRIRHGCIKVSLDILAKLSKKYSTSIFELIS